MFSNYAVTVLAMGLQAPAASVHPPEVEARLAVIVGDWTVAGQEATYREICEWYRNRSFVVCTSTDSSDGSMSQSILGFSAAEARFTYHNFASGGTSNSRVGYPHGENGLVYTLERRTAAGVVRATTYLMPQPDGRIHFREDRSVNGGPWNEAANFYSVRRNAAQAR
jgi:hypothetical protein